MKKFFNLFFIFLIILCCVACDEESNVNDDFSKKECKENHLRLWYDEETPEIGEGNPTGCMLSHGNHAVFFYVVKGRII